MIVPYWSIDLIFFFAPFICRDRAELRGHVRRVLLATAVAGICFLLWPFRMGAGFQHPPANGLFGFLFQLLGGFDKPYNLVPSLHIAYWSLVWVVESCPAAPNFRPLLGGWFVLVAASTLFTWQHHVIDVVMGQALGLFCFHVFPDSENGSSPWPAARHWKLASLYAMAAFLCAAGVLAF